MRSLLVGSILAAVLMTAAPAAEAAPRRARRTHVAKKKAKGPPKATAGVLYRGIDQLYLDKGASVGLAVGDEIQAYRNRRRRRTGRKRLQRAGRCTVTRVSVHWALCEGDKLKSGATEVHFDPRPDAREHKGYFHPDLPTPEPLTNIPAEQLEAGRAQLSSLVFEPVAFEGERGRPPYRLPVRVGLTHRSWMFAPSVSNPASYKGFHRQIVDLQFGVPIPLPFIGDGLSLRYRGQMVAAMLSPRDARYRPREPARLDIWNASIRFRPQDGYFSLEAGRILPLRAPGARVVDGVAASVRLFDDRVEVGMYGGISPDAARFFLRYDHYNAAAFGAVDWTFSDVALSARARVGVGADLNLRTRSEAELAFSGGWSRYVQAAAGLRTAWETGRVVSPNVQNGLLAPWLDLAYVDLSSSPGLGLVFFGGYRYAARSAPSIAGPSIDWGLPAGAAPAQFGFHHAHATGGWEPAGWAAVRLSAGGSLDHGSLDWRAWVGPEVGMPNIFGSSVFVGYREELGTFPARMMTSRASVRLVDFFAVRLGALGVQRREFSDPEHEVSAWGGVTFDPIGKSWLWRVRDLRTAATVRAQSTLPSLTGRKRATPAGLEAVVSLSGSM